MYWRLCGVSIWLNYRVIRMCKRRFCVVFFIFLWESSHCSDSLFYWFPICAEPFIYLFKFVYYVHHSLGAIIQCVNMWTLVERQIRKETCITLREYLTSCYDLICYISHPIRFCVDVFFYLYLLKTESKPCACHKYMSVRTSGIWKFINF